MKKICFSLISLSLLLLYNCKKDKPVTIQHQITVSDIIDSISGNYNGTSYNQAFGGGVIQYDTIYNTALLITKYNDSFLVVNQYDTLHFIGNLTNKNYRFEWNQYSVYADKFIGSDSLLKTITYSQQTDNGGFGGTNKSLTVNR